MVPVVYPILCGGGYIDRHKLVTGSGIVGIIPRRRYIPVGNIPIRMRYRNLENGVGNGITIKISRGPKA